MSAARQDLAVGGSTTSSGDRGVAVVSHVVLIIWSIIVLAPVAWTFLQSIRPSTDILSSPFGVPASPEWANYSKAWVDEGLGQALANTLIVVGCALILVMLLGGMCSYVLARYPFRGSRLLYTLLLAGLTFPPFLAIVPLFGVLNSLGLLNTKPGLILVYVAFALPFTVFFLYAFFKGLPEEISEAAEIDGAGKWRTFFQVMLPMAKGGMATIAIMNFLGLWNQYLLPVALNTRQENYVLSQAIGRLAAQAGYQTDFGKIFAAAVIVIIPVLIIYIFFQRQLQGSVTQGTMK